MNRDSQERTEPSTVASSGAGGFFLFVALALLLQLTGALPAVAADTAEKIFASHKQNILQVRIIDRGSGAKASIGSGFAVDDGSLIISNYHVVAELINRPENYRAVLVDEQNRTNGLTLLAVDVVHDLALLRAATPLTSHLDLAKASPARGEELYAFGNPHDLGLTIVTGTYNGLLEKSLYEKIHFTGSINPGMSGGPTLNRHGEVVGVNVATAGNQISFLVPVSYVNTLLSTIPEEPPDVEALSADISNQLLANQERYMADLLAEPFSPVTIGDFDLPGELADYIKCWGDTSDNPDLLYRRVHQACSSSDIIYLSPQQKSGTIRFRHELYSADKLGSTRFYRFMDRHFGSSHLTLGGREEDFTNYQCRSDFVANADVDTSAVYCLRGYKKYPGLFDLYFTAMTLQQNDEALHTTLSVAGVSAENAEAFARSYFEAIKWK